MNGLETGITVAWWVIGAAFAAGAACALWRMIKGPTIVDRMVASDTLLTIIICVLGADMVYNGHTATLPLMLALAMTAFIASVAVARYVSRQERRERPDEHSTGQHLAAGLAAGEVVSSVLEPHHREAAARGTGFDDETDQGDAPGPSGGLR